MSIELNGFSLSANTHKVRLLLALLDRPYEERQVNLAIGEQLRAEYLELNPLGQVPVLVDDGYVLRDSHAILIYLADSHGAFGLLPQDSRERAAVLQWLFFDANDLHNGIGFARNFFTFGLGTDGEGARKRGLAALAALNGHLATRDWLELNRMTLADIACAPLIEVADEARIDIGEFDNVQRWLSRLEAQPGHIPMLRRPA